MTWKPSPEPGQYDRQRVTQLQPVKDVVSHLDLPLLRRRKITGILTALEMQIEDGGDAPDVNALLLDALRAVLRHRVAGAQLAVALQALDAWERAERTYWEQMRASTRPPVELTLDERLDDLMQVTAQLARTRDQTGAVPLAPSLPTAPPPPRKPGRNAPCWCGSGRKYKLCHLDADRHPT